MVWPLRGDSDKLTSVLAAVVLQHCSLPPRCRTSPAPSSRSAQLESQTPVLRSDPRSEYAPLEARGQVFIWVGALKIPGGSAGTAVAWALIGGIGWLPVAIVAVLTAAVAAMCWIARSYATDASLGPDEAG